MDELQKQPGGMQADPQMVATVTAAVLQTLQATGTIPSGEQKSSSQPEVKTIDLIGLFFAILIVVNLYYFFFFLILVL